MEYQVTQVEAIRKYILLLAIIILIPVGASAESLYCGSSSAGLNDGSSWANQWQCSVVFASGATGYWHDTDQIGEIDAGDTLFIDGGSSGVTYTFRGYIQASGTASEYITIRPGQDSGHSGVVTWDYDGITGDNLKAFYYQGHDYIKFDGEYNGSRHFKFINFIDAADGDGDCIVFYSGAGEGTAKPIITYIEAHNINQLVEFVDLPDTVEVSYCYVTQAIGDAILTLFGNTVTDWDTKLIHHNYFNIIKAITGNPGGNGGADAIQTSYGASIYNNIFTVTESLTIDTTGQHPDGCQCNGDNMKFYNNISYGCGDAQLMGSDISPETGMTGYYIYNNIFMTGDVTTTNPIGFRLYNLDESSPHMNDILIANNLFIDSDESHYSGKGIVSFTGNSTSTTGDVTIKNNIFYNVGDSADWYGVQIKEAMPGVTWDIDYNIYYDVVYNVFEATTYTVANWLSTFEPNGSSLQPLFTTYVENDYSASDYNLQASDTVAKDQGADLSSYFTTDFNGNTRSGSWDIGPFEYQAVAGGSGAAALSGSGSASLAGPGSVAIQ